MLFAFLSVAAAVASASPIERQVETVTLPLRQHFNVSSVKNIVNKGKARINAINGFEAVAVARAADVVSSGSVTNEDVTYVAPVVIGGKTYDLIVDTGCE